MAMNSHIQLIHKYNATTKNVNEWNCSAQLLSVFVTQWRYFHPRCDVIVGGGGEMYIWRSTFEARHILGLSRYIIAPTTYGLLRYARKRYGVFVEH